MSGGWTAGETMKRTATTLALLAGLGGGCVSTEASRTPQIGGYGTVSRGQVVPGVVGPGGEPVIAARATMPGQMAATTGGEVRPAGLFRSIDGCTSCAHVPGAHAPLFGPHFDKFAKVSHGGPAMPPPYTGPGILPAPGMGPPGVVAAVGAIGPGMPGPGMVAPAAQARTSIKFTGPAGMKITWQLANGQFTSEAEGLTAPAAYNFLQGQIYRLRLTQVGPNFPGRVFYPTLEVAPANPHTLTYLAHSSVPVTFTNEDFAQAAAGNLVVKVIYLPNPENQDFAIAGAEELVSTRLDPGADPIVEAQSRGSILCIIRLGNIDLENRVSPAMNAPPAPPVAPAATPPKPPANVPPPKPAVPLPAPPAAPAATAPQDPRPTAPAARPPAALPPIAAPAAPLPAVPPPNP